MPRDKGFQEFFGFTQLDHNEVGYKTNNHFIYYTEYHFKFFTINLERKSRLRPLRNKKEE